MDDERLKQTHAPIGEADGPASVEAERLEDKTHAPIGEADVRAAGHPGPEAETIDQLKHWRADDLRKVCHDLGLPTTGRKSELVKRIWVRFHGTTATHQHGRTRCKLCGAVARVTGTKRERGPGGRVWIIRQLKCEGRNRHTYPLYEAIPPEPTEAAPEKS